MTTPNEEGSIHAGSKKSIVDVKNSQGMENVQGNQNSDNTQCNKSAEETHCDQSMKKEQNEGVHTSLIENTHASQRKTVQTVDDKIQTGSTHASQTKSIHDGSQTADDKIQAGSTHDSRTKTIHGSQIADDKIKAGSTHDSRTKTIHGSQIADDKIKAGSTHDSRTKTIHGSQIADDKIKAGSTHDSRTKTIHGSQIADDKIKAGSAHDSRTKTIHGSQIADDKIKAGSTHDSRTKTIHGSQIADDKIKAGSTHDSRTKTIHGSQIADDKIQTESTLESKTKTIHGSQIAEDKIQSGSTHASQTKTTRVSQAADDKTRTRSTRASQNTSIDDKIQNESSHASHSKKSIAKSQTKSVDTNKTKSEDTLKTKSIDTVRTDRTKSVETGEIKVVDDKSDESIQSKGSFQAKSTETVLTEISAEAVVDQKRVRELKRVCVIGARNWGTLFAKIIGTNITNLELFSNEVLLYVQEETIDGKNLTDIINETHENVKYLPGCQLPPNVVAVSDVVEAAREAHIIVFTLLQEYIADVCTALTGKIKPTAAALSLTKGFELTEDGNIDLFSQIITRILKIQTSVLMGANLCEEIACEKYCEATIGCKDKLLAAVLKELLQTEYLRVAVVDDVDAVEVCGSLRNVIACGVGFIDGLDMGRGIKATVIRLGLIEMIKFVDIFYPGSKISTFFESCGVADLATSFLAGRNREISEKFVTTEISIAQIEKELLGGHALEGPATAKKLNVMLRERDMEDRFPLFTNVAKIYQGELDPSHFLDDIIGSSEHVNVRLHHLTW